MLDKVSETVGSRAELDTTTPKEAPALSRMFFYLPPELRPGLIVDTVLIVLPGLPPSPPKPRPRPTFPKTVVGVTHDGIPPIMLKNGTIRARAGNVVYLTSKMNNNISQPVLKGEFRELVDSEHVIFVEGMSLPEDRAKAHAAMFFDHEMAKRAHLIAKLNEIEQYIRNRRSWEVEFVAYLYDEHRDVVKFHTPHAEMMALLREYGEDNLVKQWG